MKNSFAFDWKLMFNVSSFFFSGAQTNWAFCPLGSNSFRVTVNNTGSFNFYSVNNVATFLPLPFPLASLSDVSWIFN